MSSSTHSDATDIVALSDLQLVELIEAGKAVQKAVIDEYYRRCIPLYLDFLGPHWHTGFYRQQDSGISPRDQERMIDHIAALAGLKAGDRVLDVGCGIGATACHLSQRWGCQATGLTPVPAQKRIAEELAASQKAEIRVDLGHAESLPYPDNSFDAVVFFESPCHFEDRRTFFEEAKRVLKPGGRLAGEDWLATDLSNTSHRKQWIEPICKAWAIPMLGDLNEYRQLMAAAGLVSIDSADMASLMPRHKGFAVSDEDQKDLQREIDNCPNPLLALTLRGLARLGAAINVGAFTIGQVYAEKPDHDYGTAS